MRTLRRAIPFVLLPVLYSINVYTPLEFNLNFTNNTMLIVTIRQLLLSITLVGFFFLSKIKNSYVNLVHKTFLFLLFSAFLAVYKVKFDLYFYASHLLYIVFLAFVYNEIIPYFKNLKEKDGFIIIDTKEIILLLNVISLAFFFVNHTPATFVLYLLLLFYTLRNYIDFKYVFIISLIVLVCYCLKLNDRFNNNAAINILSQCFNNEVISGFSINELGLHQLSIYSLTSALILVNKGVLHYLMYIFVIIICLISVFDLRDDQDIFTSLLNLYLMYKLICTLVNITGFASSCALNSIRNDLPVLITFLYLNVSNMLKSKWGGI